MRLPRLAIINTQFTLTIFFLLVLVGIVSYFNMPRSEDPQFDLPITIVEVIYPGASPSDIETLVIKPLEEAFSDIENIKKSEAQIKNGGGRIELHFTYGTNGEDAYNKVKQAVSKTEPDLPSGVQKVLVLKATPNSVAIAQLALWNDPLDYKEMELYAKQLEKRIEAISGIRKVDIWGYPQQVVAVDLNLALLKHHKVSVNQVTQAIQLRAANITPGFVDGNTRRFNVKTSGNFKHLPEIENTVIVSGHNFSLRLKDVANVAFSHITPSYLAYHKEKPAIFITVQQSENTNIFALTERIENEVNSFKDILPHNMKIDTIFKQADSVEIRVNGFFDNLWQGLIIVAIMALLFLGLRESLVIILAIPLSFLIAIGWLDLSGFGLQQMSIVGLIIALGLLVDNAIVVTESIHREKKHCSNLLEASVAGTAKVGWSIISGTLTTMLAFLPMLMLASNTGDFVRSMPVTVVLVLVTSLLIALTLTPLIASHFFTLKPSKTKMLQHYVNIFAKNVYQPLLFKLIKIKWLTILVSIIVLVAMLSLFPKVGVSLFPKAEKPMLLIDVETPANSSLAYTDIIMQDVAKHVQEYSLVTSVSLNVGNSNPRIYYNETPRRGVERYGQLLVVLTEYNEEKVTTLVTQLRRHFLTDYRAKISVKEFTQGPVTDQPVTIRLMSESLADLEQVAADLENKMKNIKGIVNVESPIGLSNSELSIGIDYDKAGLSNISINQLDNTLSTLLSGAFVGKYSDINGENYPIVVRNKIADINSLNDVFLTNSFGEQIPLNQITKTELKKGQSEFFHYQKLRMAKVSADVGTGFSVNEITQEVVTFLKQYQLPKGMYFLLGGEEETRQESFAGLAQIMLITAIGIFAVLVFQFRSFLQPLVIFSSIPFAIAGAVLGLYITGLSFSMMAFIGLISLFGIVVNNAIILIDTVNRNIAGGFDIKGAVLNAGATRFTPILLTTITTIGGLLPLTILGGGMWEPLGVVIISGLCVSAVSSFLLVPILTELFTTENKSLSYIAGNKQGGSSL